MSTFHIPIGHGFGFFIFWEIFIQVFCLFFNRVILLLLLLLLSSLYILYINFLSYVEFENIFSHFVGYLFTILIVFLAVQKLLLWCNPTCQCFALLPMLLGSYPKNHCWDQCREAVHLCFLLVGLHFWTDFRFKSLIHSELIFEYGVR